MEKPTSLAPPAVAGSSETRAATPGRDKGALVLRALGSRHALAAMMVAAAVDGSLVPAAPFALLGPMVLARPRKAVPYALAATWASLAGGAVGYALGRFAGTWAQATLGVDLDVRINTFGLGMTVAEVLAGQAWLLAVLAGVLPTPFSLVAIGAGLLRIDPFAFGFAVIAGRSARMLGFCLALAYARDVAVRVFRVRVV